MRWQGKTAGGIVFALNFLLFLFFFSRKRKEGEEATTINLQQKNEPSFEDSLNLNQGTILQYKSVYLVTVL